MERFGKLRHNVLLAIVSFFWSGLISKKMPGTIGSIIATSILLVTKPTHEITILLAFCSFVIGSLACKCYIPAYESNRDPGYIVIDEVCGIFLGASIIEYFGYCSSLDLFINFVLFRIFDIFKPFPIRNIELYMKNKDKLFAIGIMLDDMLATILSSAIQITAVAKFL